MNKSILTAKIEVNCGTSPIISEVNCGTSPIISFIAPAWVISSINEQPSKPIIEAIKTVLMRRIHWLEYLGIVCGIIGMFFTIRNYLTSTYAGRGERSVVNVLSRIIGRSID